MTAKAKRTVVRKGANHRVRAIPAIKTPAAPITAERPNGFKYQAATTGMAAPIANAAAGPTRSMARGSQEVPIAAPTRIPDSIPVQSDQ